MKEYKKAVFGLTKDGREVTVYTLTNDNGMSMNVLDYGCRIQSLLVPDKDGKVKNVAAGFPDMEKYEAGGCFGALIGRFANRIKGAKFTLDGTEYTLPQNDHENYIHGDFEHTFFRCEPYDDRLVFTYLSPDGEWGFPGNVILSVTYALTEGGAVELTYKAMTDAPTVINITNHSYFNMEGLPEDYRTVTPEDVNVYENELLVNAGSYLEADDINMVTGSVIDVTGTGFDFRERRPIGESLYDHNFCIDGYDGTLRKAAELSSEKTGIHMEVYTTQPGIQVYTGSKKSVALETQHYPDGPHYPDWPDTTLRPGEVYTEKTVYSFWIG